LTQKIGSINWGAKIKRQCPTSSIYSNAPTSRSMSGAQTTPKRD